MKIKLQDGVQVAVVLNRLEQYLAESRFTAQLDTDYTTIVILKVRLRESKPYCGNHAGPCQINTLVGPQPHMRLRYLEGLDWVSFNDMLNDCLDALNIEAKVWSMICNIRKGRLRRTEYSGGWDNGGEWAKNPSFSYWEDYCGRTDAPRSDYPSGTPGLAEWRREYAEAA